MLSTLHNPYLVLKNMPLAVKIYHLIAHAYIASLLAGVTELCVYVYLYAACVCVYYSHVYHHCKLGRPATAKLCHYGRGLVGDAGGLR